MAQTTHTLELTESEFALIDLALAILTTIDVLEGTPIGNIEVTDKAREMAGALSARIEPLYATEEAIAEAERYERLELDL